MSLQEPFWDSNLFWNSSLPRVSRFFQETAINGPPISLLLLSVIIIFNARTKQVNSREIIWRARLIACVAVIIGYLSWMIRWSEKYSHQVEATLSEALLFGLSAFKIFLYITLTWLIYQRRAAKIDGFLWTASLFELIYLTIRAYHDYLNSEVTSSLDLAVMSLQVAASLTVFLLFTIDGIAHETEIKSGLKSKDQSSFGSRILGVWLADLMAYGKRNSLKQNELPALPRRLAASIVSRKFEKQFFKHRSNKATKRGSIKSQGILLTLFWKELSLAFFITLVQEVLLAPLPILAKLFMQFMNDSAAPEWHGYFIGLSMALLTITGYLLKFNSSELIWQTKVKMQSSLSSAIYGKLLRLRQNAGQEFSVGKMLNLISIDITAFGEMLQNIALYWTGPIRLAISTGLLYWTVGNAAFVGLGLWVLILAARLHGGNILRRLTACKLPFTDKRVKLINEVLNGIKSVKLYAWEECIMKEIKHLRNGEMTILGKISNVEAITISIYSIGPIVCVLSILAFQWIFDPKRISADTMLIILPIIDLLIAPLNLFTFVHQQILTALLSLKRINSFLNLDEPETYVRREPGLKAIEVSKAIFTWSKQKKPSKNDEERSTQASLSFKLKSISLNAGNGDFVCIIGQVGAGKTSLLDAILGEMCLAQGKVSLPVGASISLVSQESWIQNMSLRENILFGKAFNEDWYHQVVSACDLWTDIAMLPHGDETLIGENGINLSGGQKQRVSLARAVYHDTDIYMLDDCLSALDAHVSRHIYERVLSSKTGLLKMKTRFMATNRVDFLSEVDKVIVLDNGSIKWSGDFSQFLASDILPDAEEARYFLQDLVQTNSSNLPSIGIHKSEKKEEEGMKHGVVSAKVYRTLWQMSPKPLVFMLASSFIISVSASVYSRIILVAWSESSEPGFQFHVLSYALVSSCEGIASYISLFILGKIFIQACHKLYLESQLAILYCPLRYFDTTPIGRILNRFSQDLNGLDTIARMYSRSTFWWITALFPAFLGSIYQLPETSMVMIPIGIIVTCLWKFYMPACRQLKRIESVSRSPIYSKFRETISGLISIRAFQASERFSREFFQALDVHASSAFLSGLAIVWRELISGLIPAFLYVSITIFGVTRRNHISPATVGLLLSYAVRIAEILKILSLNLGEVEVHLVAAERLLEYCELPREGERFKKPGNMPNNWPGFGALEMKSYTARYHNTSNMVLRDLTLSVKKGEKIGIAGRTGAGKSSLTLAIYRLIERISGSIIIDGVDISEIGLFHLRSNLTIIPQDPVIFSGAVRFNLDPFGKYSDNEIWRCLELARLKGYFQKFGQGLNYQIEEGGKNLSTGQKQLICLARAMLKKSKLIILDEATGSIDMETDSLIQDTLRTEFKECTMLIVAHRLDTIINCDRVMVLEGGNVIEFDSPQNLLRDKSSHFSKLAREAKISIDQ